MKCPNCGAAMTALFTSVACSAECDLKPKKPAPSPYFGDLGTLDDPFSAWAGGSYSGPLAAPGTPALVTGSRAWAIAMHTQGVKLEYRMVPLQGTQGFYVASNWFPSVKDPADPGYDDYPPLTTEWRIA